MKAKIILAILIAVVLVGGIFTVRAIASTSSPIYGDANGDHKVNMGDVVNIARQILGIYPFTESADANQNGTVSVGDIAYVERQILGLEPVYGDADGNLEVNQADVAYVSRVILGVYPATPGCDANQDGSVDVADMTMIEIMEERK